MIFMNPKTDFAFNKIFGSTESKDILISFLNAIVYDEQPCIVDLFILNPRSVLTIRGIKDTYIDVKVWLNDGTTVIIKLQVLNVEGFKGRILYKAAKAHSIQIDKGHKYKLINPIIALTITDFIMFDSIDKVTTHFILKDIDYLVDYTFHDLELVFVELPKFTKNLEQLDTLTDRWLYFLKNAYELNIIPAHMQEVPELQKAFQIADRFNLTREEFDVLQKQELFLQEHRNAIIKAKKEGHEQGEKNKAIKIAEKLRHIMDISKVCEITELTREEIETLPWR